MPPKTFKPFSEKLAENLKDLYDRVFKHKKAALIVIDGGIGEGKTTLAVSVGDAFNSLHGVDAIDIKAKKQIAMGGEEFAKKLIVCHTEGLPVLLYDEAGDFNKRGSLSRFNALLNRTFETYRAFKIIVILILPNFLVLDQDLFDKNIPRLLIHVYARTSAQGNGMGFSLYRMHYLREKMKKLIVKSQAYGFVEPNFYMHFKDLPQKRSRELDLVSTKGKLKELKAAEIKFEGLISYSEIARKVGRSEFWVQQALKKCKVKSVKTFQRKAYFNSNAVDILLNFQEEGGAIGTKKTEANT